jgi:hypothetical protein
MRSFQTVLLLALFAACSHSPPADVVPEMIPEATLTNARVAPAERPVAPGDCPEALRRALAKPDLAVDRIPAPVVAKPPALQKIPRTALRKDGSAEVNVDVLIDTLGQAVMSTFTVVKTSSPLLASNVKSVIGKWTFSPAELAGCKVPRVFHFMAATPARRAK